MSKITDEMVEAVQDRVGCAARCDIAELCACRIAIVAVYPLIEKQVREECARLKPGWLRREIDAAERDEIVDAAIRRLREDIRKAMRDTKP